MLGLFPRNAIALQATTATLSSSTWTVMLRPGRLADQYAVGERARVEGVTGRAQVDVPTSPNQLNSAVADSAVRGIVALTLILRLH